MCHLKRNKSFVTKALRKTIMTNFRLKNIYNKQRSHVNWDNKKNKTGIFVLHSFVKRNTTTSIILVLNVSAITESFGKQFNRISVTKGHNPTKYFCQKGKACKKPCHSNYNHERLLC